MINVIKDEFHFSLKGVRKFFNSTVDCLCAISFNVYMSRKAITFKSPVNLNIQSNFNGSNTLGTMKICSRQG